VRDTSVAATLDVSRNLHRRSVSIGWPTQSAILIRKAFVGPSWRRAAPARRRLFSDKSIRSGGYARRQRRFLRLLKLKVFNPGMEKHRPPKGLLPASAAADFYQPNVPEAAFRAREQGRRHSVTGRRICTH
jgi:hypothetical protein